MQCSVLCGELHNALFRLSQKSTVAAATEGIVVVAAGLDLPAAVLMVQMLKLPTGAADPAAEALLPSALPRLRPSGSPRASNCSTMSTAAT